MALGSRGCVLVPLHRPGTPHGTLGDQVVGSSPVAVHQPGDIRRTRAGPNFRTTRSTRTEKMWSRSKRNKTLSRLPRMTTCRRNRYTWSMRRSSTRTTPRRLHGLLCQKIRRRQLRTMSRPWKSRRPSSRVGGPVPRLRRRGIGAVSYLPTRGRGLRPKVKGIVVRHQTHGVEARRPRVRPVRRRQAPRPTRVPGRRRQVVGVVVRWGIGLGIRVVPT